MQFPCECNCKNCMINYLQSFTENKVILNYFEKSNKYLIKEKNDIVLPSICSCGGFFNYDVIIRKLQNDLTVYQDNAILRLKEMIRTHCMICSRDIKNHSFRYVELTQVQKNSSTHLICNKCFRGLSKDINGFFCSLCGSFHNLTKSSLKRNRDGDDSCCILF